MKFSQYLKDMHACEEAIKWVGNKTAKQSWKTCPRPDWMLWLLTKQLGKKGWPTRKQLVAAACDCAETVLHFVPAKEKRPAKALAITRKWLAGKATLKQVREAADAAFAAAFATAYVADAAYAAASAADAAYAADAADAATAAAAAAAAAAYAADAAAYAAGAQTKANKQMADIIRKRIPTVPNR